MDSIFTITNARNIPSLLCHERFNEISLPTDTTPTEGHCTLPTPPAKAAPAKQAVLLLVV
jgi:hypothetical protein